MPQKNVDPGKWNQWQCRADKTSSKCNVDWLVPLFMVWRSFVWSVDKADMTEGPADEWAVDTDTQTYLLLSQELW